MTAELFSEEVESAEQLIADNEARATQQAEFGERQLTNVPELPGITVRFRTNPEKENWLPVWEKWEPSAGTKGLLIPCPKGELNSEGRAASKRFLVNAVDVKENKPVVLKLAKTLMDSLLRKYNNKGSLTDRDWTLTRYGTGKKTEYEAEEEAKVARDLERYTFPDSLKEIWQKQANAMADVAQVGPDDFSNNKKSLV